MLNYRFDQNFFSNARRLIVGAEGFQNGSLYPDSKGIPTIGYGYALLIKNKEKFVLNDNIMKDFQQSDIPALTDDQKKVLIYIATLLKAEFWGHHT